MHSKTYMLGFWCGIALVAVFATLFRVWMKKKSGKNAPDYDERQAAIRGKGFQLAYITALLVMIFGGTAELSFGVSWCNLFTFAMIALWSSICVFTSYCVVKDAYFTLRSQRKPLIIIMAAAAVINLVVSIGHIRSGTLLTPDGMLGTPFVNLITGAGCLYLAVFMLAWTLHERRQEIEE